MDFNFHFESEGNDEYTRIEYSIGKHYLKEKKGSAYIFDMFY